MAESDLGSFMTGNSFLAIVSGKNQRAAQARRPEPSTIATSTNEGLGSSCPMSAIALGMDRETITSKNTAKSREAIAIQSSRLTKTS